MKNTVEKAKLDYEWIELIKEAQVLGLEPEEVRLFLLEFDEVK